MLDNEEIFRQDSKLSLRNLGECQIESTSNGMTLRTGAYCIAFSPWTEFLEVLG